VRNLASVPFVANRLDDSDEAHEQVLGQLYDPQHKWPIIAPGIIDMRLFSRAKMVGFDAASDATDEEGGGGGGGAARDALRPAARKLSEMMKRDMGSSVYRFVCWGARRVRAAPD